MPPFGYVTTTSENEEREPRDAPPGVVGMLTAGVGVYVGCTLLIGFGVASSWCFGLGFLLMWVGSRGVLGRAARDAGFEPETQGWAAGVFAVGLASLLGSVGVGTLLALEAAGITWEASLPAGFAATFLFGAGLAPIALTPFASAAGTEGWVAPVVRAIDFAGSDRVLPLSAVCGLIALVLVVPIPLVFMGIIGFFANEPLWGLGGMVAGSVWFVSVPLSAVALMRRYRRLLHQDDAPSHLGVAAAPVLAGLLIGLLALGAAAAVAMMTSHGGPLDVDPAARLLARITVWTQVCLGLAAALFTVAVWWLGRVGASLRLLARPPFRFAGTLRVADADGVVFVPDNGLHAVRVSHRHIERSPDAPNALEADARAELLSPSPLGGEGYRQADVACPRGAMLMAGGTPEAALGRHLARARRLAFRIAVVGLVAMGLAAVSILVAL